MNPRDMIAGQVATAANPNGVKKWAAAKPDADWHGHVTVKKKDGSAYRNGNEVRTPGGTVLHKEIAAGSAQVAADAAAARAKTPEAEKEVAAMYMKAAAMFRDYAKSTTSNDAAKQVRRAEACEAAAKVMLSKAKADEDAKRDLKVSARKFDTGGGSNSWHFTQTKAVLK